VTFVVTQILQLKNFSPSCQTPSNHYKHTHPILHVHVVSSIPSPLQLSRSESAPDTIPLTSCGFSASDPCRGHQNGYQPSFCAAFGKATRLRRGTVRLSSYQQHQAAVLLLCHCTVRSPVIESHGSSSSCLNTQSHNRDDNPLAAATDAPPPPRPRITKARRTAEPPNPAPPPPPKPAAAGRKKAAGAAAAGPTRDRERALWSKGFGVVAGVDEAGRGPLAGPVVAAACVLPPDLVLEGLDDSKKLTEEERDSLYDRIISAPGVSWAV